ncbi:MAG: MFS transporter, partial [Stackebrandtia sp.]
MLVFSQRARVADVKSLSRRMYAYAFLDDFVLLYPVYALLFAENGLSVAEISSLFVIWSVTGLVLEVPSGALADATSRRLLMTVGPLLSAAGFGIWVLFESYPAFALGFILWGVKGALQSGAQEALLYEELDRLGGADRYATVVGRSRAFGTGGILLATALAAPVFGLGGYPALGAASAAACLACALVASGFPEHRQARDASGPGSAFREYADTLRQGLREVRGNPPARRAVLLIPVVAGIWGSLEEYVPLLAASATPRTQTVALLILLVSAGVAAGALLSGRAARLRMRGVAWLLAAAAIGLAAGALSGRLLG